MAAIGIMAGHAAELWLNISDAVRTLLEAKIHFKGN